VSLRIFTTNVFARVSILRSIRTTIMLATEHSSAQEKSGRSWRHSAQEQRTTRQAWSDAEAISPLAPVKDPEYVSAGQSIEKFASGAEEFRSTPRNKGA
jgi:hypothetical protein